MMRPHGPWTIKSSRQIYSDSFVQVRGDDVVRPDGDDGHHVVVTMKAGVCVVALEGNAESDATGYVYLTSEFHYGIGRVSLEGVSGGIDAAESTLETARRELKEELGITAMSWESLGSIDPFTTIVVSPTELFVATDLEFGDTDLEGTELIKLVRMPLKEAVQMVIDGEITHGPTCVLLLKLDRIRRVDGG